MVFNYTIFLKYSTHLKQISVALSDVCILFSRCPAQARSHRTNICNSVMHLDQLDDILEYSMVKILKYHGVFYMVTCHSGNITWTCMCTASTGSIKSGVLTLTQVKRNRPFHLFVCSVFVWHVLPDCQCFSLSSTEDLSTPGLPSHWRRAGSAASASLQRIFQMEANSLCMQVQSCWESLLPLGLPKLQLCSSKKGWLSVINPGPPASLALCIGPLP